MYLPYFGNEVDISTLTMRVLIGIKDFLSSVNIFNAPFMAMKANPNVNLLHFLLILGSHTSSIILLLFSHLHKSNVKI